MKILTKFKYLFVLILLSVFYYENAFAVFDIKITFRSEAYIRYVLSCRSGDFAAHFFIEREHLQIANLLETQNYPPKIILNENDNRFFIFREDSNDGRIHYNIAVVDEDFEMDPPQILPQEDEDLDLGCSCTSLFDNFRFFHF